MEWLVNRGVGRLYVVLLTTLLLFSCDGGVDQAEEATQMISRDPNAHFWAWFQDNMDRFEDEETVQEQLGDELRARLSEIDENLVFEISVPAHEEKELVISADGIKESFPAVRSLVEQAPTIPGWTVTAFRQRVDLAKYNLTYEGIALNANEFHYLLQSEGDSIDLILFVPGLNDDNRRLLIGACYILLDMALGEEDVSLNIRYIDHHPVPPDPRAEGLKPLTELPAEFDAVRTAIVATKN